MQDAVGQLAVDAPVQTGTCKPASEEEKQSKIKYIRIRLLAIFKDSAVWPSSQPQFTGLFMKEQRVFLIQHQKTASRSLFLYL